MLASRGRHRWQFAIQYAGEAPRSYRSSYLSCARPKASDLAADTARLVVPLRLAGTPFLVWAFHGEAFLAHTNKVPARVLVVEGWIGIPGIRAAAAEFESGNYGWIVATGGLTGERWFNQRWSYARMAQHELFRAGIARDRVILAEAKDAESQRTYESAVACWTALNTAGLKPEQVNIFTLGPHARRSRLIFATTCPWNAQVGVIAWIPERYSLSPWWRSSDRASDFMTETAAYFYELLFNSARDADQLHLRFAAFEQGGV